MRNIATRRNGATVIGRREDIAPKDFLWLTIHIHDVSIIIHAIHIIIYILLRQSVWNRS